MNDLNAWDIVHILRVDRIQFRSGPPGSPIDPHGNWVIVGFIGPDALLAKDGTIVKAPIMDIKRVGVFSRPTEVMDILKSMTDKNNSIDMVEAVSKEMSWDEVQARSFILRYNLPQQAINEQHKQSIIQRVKRLEEGGYDG